MVRYRRRLDIIADILHAAGDGEKKTRIMHYANLSHELIEKYLGQTMMMGYIMGSDGGYRVTEKGRAFLEKYRQFSRRYSRTRKRLEAMEFDWELLEKMCRDVGDPRARAKSKRRRLVRSKKLQSH
jgi:predicted transcriptional regulator